MSDTISHAVGHSSHAHASGHHGHEVHADLSDSNIRIQTGGLSTALILLGLVGVGVAVATGFLGLGFDSAAGKVQAATHAMAAIHIGLMCAVAICLGSLFFVMASHLTMAGWSVTIRRQFENIASLVWFPGLLVIVLLLVDIAQGGRLFPWLNKQVAGGDYLYAKKAIYLNPMFLMVRSVFYVAVWSYLAWRLAGMSKEQDRTGDRWITNKARFTSSWGMLLFALTTAFAGFDWLKTIDWRFFSTMWGVYFFAGAAYSAMATGILVFALLRRSGKLEGLMTAEHTHDMTKLLFAFTCFWAYIAYSQYFLIWYANIPEETAFFLVRKTNGWQYLFYGLIAIHFILPFYLLLWRGIRRSLTLMAVFALLALVAQATDIYWIIRPALYAKDEVDKLHLDKLWLDLAGILGVLFVFLGLVWRKVGSGVLIPTQDPRLGEAIAHKNYV